MKNKLIDIVNRVLKQHWYTPLYKSIQIAEALLENDVVVVTNGKWNNVRFLTTGDGRKRVGECSVCGSMEVVRTYCPECGAKNGSGD